MDPCSEIMTFFERAQKVSRDVRFARFDVHGMDVQNPRCYADNKIAELTFDIYEISFFGFRRTGSQKLSIDPAKVKVVATKDDEIVTIKGVEAFRAYSFSFWQKIWG